LPPSLPHPPSFSPRPPPHFFLVATGLDQMAVLQQIVSFFLYLMLLRMYLFRA